MNIIPRLFNREPNALQVSDWLKNMQDAFVERASGLVDRNTSSPDMLVFFTMTSCTISMDNILHHSPSILSSIGPVFRELRAYYECLWQLVLLGKYTSQSDNDKISKLYADVELRTDRNIQALFSTNQNIKRLLV